MKIRIRQIVVLVLLCQPICVLAAPDGNVSSTGYDLSDIIMPLITVLVSAVVSLVVLRANRFNDSVTKVRSIYIEEFRQVSAAFLTSVTENEKTKGNNSNGEIMKCECEEKPARYYYYRLMLMLNPTQPGSYWDNDMKERMTRLMNSSPHKITDKDVQNLVSLFQSDLALEWHGMMEEGKRGELSETDKDKLRMKYYLNFKNKIR